MVQTCSVIGCANRRHRDAARSFHIGGAELLCGNVKKHNVELPSQDKKWHMKSLLVWIRDNIIQERSELFLQGETVRPGILVLINDADWELMGELEYELEANDTIVFISTLHGG